MDNELETRDIVDYNDNVVGQLSFPVGTSEEVWTAALAPYLIDPGSVTPGKSNLTISSSIAIDKNGVNQSVIGTLWTVISANRVLWNLGQHIFSLLDFLFRPATDGIYVFDLGIKVTNLTNVTRVKVGLFLNGDLWFIVGEHTIQEGQTEVYINNFVTADMYSGDAFDVRISLEGTLPSATIIGDDDYTAWGFGISTPFA